MIKKSFFPRYRYDIALEADNNPRLVTWVSALMVFFVALSLSASFALADITRNWTVALSGSLTIELVPPLADDGRVVEAGQILLEQNIAAIQNLQKSHPSVAAVRVLDEVEVRALIAPWLGRDVPEDMLLPNLLDVTVAPGADVEGLKKDIAALVPEAAIDDHNGVLTDMRTLVATVRHFVFLLTGVIVLLAIVSIAGIVRAKFMIHAREVETLHLLGTPDEYIARQFRRYTLSGVLQGGLLGLFCMGAVLWWIGHVTGTVDSAIIPQLQMAPLQWALLLLAPLVAGSLIAHMTAQHVVMKELARLP